MVTRFLSNIEFNAVPCIRQLHTATCMHSDSDAAHLTSRVPKYKPYVQPFQRYLRGCKILKLVTWPWPRPFQRRFVTDRLEHTYSPNLKCLTSPITEIWKALQNVENGVVWRVRDQPKLSAMSTFDRLYTTSYLSFIEQCIYLVPFSRYSELFVEMCHFCRPHMHLALPLGVISLVFHRDFWREKVRVPGLSYGIVCVILDLAVFVELPSCDGRMDGHCPHDDSIYHAGIARLVKNQRRCFLWNPMYVRLVYFSQM